MKKLLLTFKDKLYKNLLLPIIQSVSPLREAAIGSAVGMFVGLTPTVGIQMWIVFMIWLFCKYILKIKFDLVIGTALVWISNPLTMFFLYYGFLVTGTYFFQVFNIEFTEVSFSAFSSKLSLIVDAADKSGWVVFVEGSKFLLIELGFPMVIGSLFYAIPIALLSYKGTMIFLKQYRIRCAESEGMDYESWRRKHER
ncbi:MAG: DUF2062 domain-containing protein [Proteobacteria bacterium]|nr:DUF2062 domain-containing protein [Pseudomonadota bacterium]